MSDRSRIFTIIVFTFTTICLISIMTALCVKFIYARREANYNDTYSEKYKDETPVIVLPNEKDEDDVPERGRNTIVVYFSCTGNTEEIAERIASLTKADIYEIKPKVAYTDEDLNWNDSSSRAYIEQHDSTARVELESEPISFEEYKFVFIGYPIWFGEEPRIMDTFVEEADLSGTKIIPFCTSGSSPIGSSADNLKELSNNKRWEEGMRFDTSTSDKELSSWITSVWGDIERELEPLQDIGENYYKEPSISQLVSDPDTGFMYVQNQLLISCELGTPKDKVEKICKKYDAEIVGYMEISSDFQIEFKDDKTYDELESIASKIESKYDFVRMVSFNTVTTISYD